MSVSRSHLPSRAPPAGSVASGRSHRTSKAHDDGPEFERRRSTATRAATVVPADSISQAGDPPEAGPSKSRSARSSQAGSQRLTAEALEALSERKSDLGGHAAVAHHVEVVEDAPPTRTPTYSRAASKSLQTKAASDARSRATARPTTVAASEMHPSASAKTSSSKAAPAVPTSKPGSVAPTHRSSRQNGANIVEVTESAGPARPATSVARSRYSEKASLADKSVAAQAVPPKSIAPSQARSRATSRSASKASGGSSFRSPSAQVAGSAASHNHSHHSTTTSAKSVASHAPSHATSHHSAVTAAKSGASHTTSRHSSHHEHSTPPSSPSAPTTPEPPPAFEEKSVSMQSETKDPDSMQLVQRSSYDVVAPHSTSIDIVERKRRDGKLLEREYAVTPRYVFLIVDRSRSLSRADILKYTAILAAHHVPWCCRWNCISQAVPVSAAEKSRLYA